MRASASVRMNKKYKVFFAVQTQFLAGRIRYNL